ncbi:CapA family protein [Actinomadura geliboluensis]|uniref:CapA family protein n=1 Tax=Actinomadura geliboluensis TaxID=882440 RepID=A0A5S4H988_9ACTN|nr:CapA family protein [Actinomadura geliboluensis]TMR41549.1 CapA family protein [Actinomadura geliboluensis]
MSRRGKAAVAAVLVGTAMTAAACGGSGDSEAEGAGPPSATSGAAGGGGATKPPAPAKEPIIIAFGGDTHFEGQLRARLGNPSTALGPVARQLRAADFTMLNLETAITTGGTPAPGKQYAFRAPATAFKALKAAGVDVVSMANNHGMDFMDGGLRDSLAAIKRTGFPVVGIGKDEDDAFKPYRVTVKGNKLAVVGATQVLDDNLIQAWTATDTKGGLASAKNVPRMVQAVKEARKGSDVVIVHLHWGAELQPCPLPRQKELAQQLVEAGADIIVGGHAHIPLGGGYMDNAYVHYGMGNFVFYSANGQTAKSGVLFLKVQDGKVTKDKWSPALISGGVPIPMKGAAAKAELKRWNGLRGCTGLSASPES